MVSYDCGYKFNVKSHKYNDNLLNICFIFTLTNCGILLAIFGGCEKYIK